MEKAGVSTLYSLVIMGGSAGSLEVILKTVSALKTTIGFSLVIVLHRKKTSDTLLSGLLSTKTNLPVREIEDKEILEPGTIYIAPPDYHLLFEDDGTMSLDYSEKVNYSRPGIDVSFESASEVYKEKLITVLLSGSNSDGADGFKIVKRGGGTTIAQEPATASFPFMPQQAIDYSSPDFILTPDELVEYLNRF
ncbi:MAG: chemotaxis protein CheB [Bacteroidia bacterium]|nr:chemotaxis protein CheB [Bacteroidia bacterium]